MKRLAGLSLGTAVALAAAVAFAQGSSGALPPVEAQPAPPASAQPAPPPQPPPAQPAPPPGAQPAPGAQPPPPAYAPGWGPPPGYAYPPPPRPPPPEPVRSVSLTLSPLHLILPVFELTAEVRVVDHFGLAVIGGYGSVTVEDNLGQSEKFSAWELGGQAVWYPMKPFDGLHVGAELLYLKVESDDLQDGEIRGAGNGLAVGPLVGYKLLTSGGFTFVAQGGLEYVAIEAEANDTAGNSASEEDSRWLPLLNLNLGYSF